MPSLHPTASPHTWNIGVVPCTRLHVKSVNKGQLLERTIFSNFKAESHLFLILKQNLQLFLILGWNLSNPALARADSVGLEMIAVVVFLDPFHTGSDMPNNR